MLIYPPNRFRAGMFASTYFLVAAFLAAGCADLKGINKFSLDGAQVVAQPFPYGYNDYCFDSCYVYDNSAGVSHYPCDCAIAVKYDTTVTREAAKLSAYFVAIGKLSGKGEVINIDTLTGAVAAGNYGKLTITSTDASVATAVGTAIQDLATASFKSRHLSENLHRYGGAVDSALGSYIQHLEALDGQSHDLQLYLLQRLIVYRATAPNGDARWPALYAYNQKIKDLEDRHARFQKQIQQIQTIKAGYRTLVANADDVKSKVLKTQLLALVNNISYINK